MRLLRSALTLVTVVALTSACHSNSPQPKPSALRLCEQALHGKQVASAQLTTVGDVRAWRIGPGSQPALHAFGSASDRSAAAWCWTNDGQGLWTAYGVGPNKDSVAFGSTNGGTAAPTGAPAFP
jgi:hypothetical protein